MATVALVVGGTRRIGRWCAEALLVAGHRVHATWHAHEAEAQGFSAEMGEAGYEVGLHRADALDGGELATVVADVVRQEGGLNVLLNCWGPSVYAPLSETSPAQLAALLNSNVVSVHSAVLAALPHLQEAGRKAREELVGPAPSPGREAEGDSAATGEGAGPTDLRVPLVGGRIINFLTAGSDTARAYRDIPAYAAAKAALASYSRSLARELAGDWVTVNCISLGVAELPAEGVPEVAAERIPSGRRVDREDLAAALWYLTSPPAAQLTGAVLNLAGGFGL